MKRTILFLLATLLGLSGWSAAASAEPQPSNLERVVLSQGHVDAVAPHFEDGELDIRVKDDTGTTPVFRDPQDVLFHVRPGAETELPPKGTLDPGFDFIYDIGNPVWMLPLTQDPGLLWPGWSSETISAGAFEGGAAGTLDWSLTGMYGQDGAAPAGLGIWDTSPFGVPQNKVFNTPLGLPQTYTQPAGVHAHYFWGFGAEGLYRLCFEVSGTPVGGQRVSSGPVEYRFFVGDLADMPADSPGEPCRPAERSLTITGLGDHYHPGDLLSLSLQFDPEEDHPHVHWYRADPGSDVWAEIGGGLTLQRTLTLADDGSRIKAVHGHGAETLESSPVTVSVKDHSEPPPDEEPPPTEEPDLAVRLSALGPNTYRAAKKSGALKVRIRSSLAARVSVKASVPAKAAKRTGLARKRRGRVVLGVGAVRVAAGAPKVANIRLRPWVRKALTRMRGRVQVKYVAEVVTDDQRRGTAGTSRILRR